MEKGYQLLIERSTVTKGVKIKRKKRNQFKDTIRQLNQCESEHRTLGCGCDNCPDSRICIDWFDLHFA